MIEVIIDGTPCELFVDNYCTHLEPAELGCVGIANCARFEGDKASAEFLRLYKELEVEREYIRNMNELVDVAFIPTGHEDGGWCVLSVFVTELIDAVAEYKA